MPGCAENVVNTMVSSDFQFSGSWSFRCPGGGFGCHLGGFLVTLGSLFLVFEGPGKMLEFRWIFKDSLEGPDPENPPSGW